MKELIKESVLKLYKLTKENPLMASILFTTCGGILYIHGHVLLSSYLLGANFNLIDYTFDILPLPRGLIITAGLLILVLIFGFIFLNSCVLYLVEKKKILLPVILVVVYFYIIFFLTNMAPSTSENLNFTGMLIGFIGLFFCFIFVTLFYMIFNLHFAYSTLISWFHVFLFTYMFNPNLKNYLDLSLVSIVGLTTVFWIYFFVSSIFQKIGFKKGIKALLLLPYNFTFALSIILILNVLTKLDLFYNFLIFIIIFVVSVIVCLVFININDKHLELKSITKEFNNIFEGLSIYWRIGISMMIVVLILPSMVIFSGKSMNLLANQTIHEIKIDNKIILGRYIGSENGLHYYVENNSLYRTQHPIEISPSNNTSIQE